MKKNLQLLPENLLISDVILEVNYNIFGFYLEGYIFIG